MHNYKEYDICYKKGKTMISPPAVRLRQKSLQVFLEVQGFPLGKHKLCKVWTLMFSLKKRAYVVSTEFLY